MGSAGRVPPLPVLLLGAFTMYLELALLRFAPAQIPVIGYLKNLLFLAIFSGLGVGALLAGRRPRWGMSLWAFTIGLSLMSAADAIGLTTIRFPGGFLDMWERGGEAAGHVSLLREWVPVVLLLAVGSLMFVGVGQRTAELLTGNQVLHNYVALLGGQMLGIGLFAAMLPTGWPAWVWMGVAMVGMSLLTRRRFQGSAASWIPVLLLLLPFGLLLRDQHGPGQRIHWSPYSRLEVLPEYILQDNARLSWRVLSNRDILNRPVDLRPETVRRYPEWAKDWQLPYDLPFLIAGPGVRVLIGGAGTGNDVAAGLRARVRSIEAVEIDPELIKIGREIHPERPYHSAIVTPHVDDVRAFLQSSATTWDLILYSIIDSHTSLAATSSHRLETSLYTREGFQAAFRRLDREGILCVSFHLANRFWISACLAEAITAAGGAAPLVSMVGHRVFFFAGPGLDTARAKATLKANGLAWLTIPGEGFRPVRDDWPFLYLNPDRAPTMYLGTLLLVALGGLLAIRLAVRGAAGPWRSSSIGLFLLGAGFMLIETRALAVLATVLGGQWVTGLAVLFAATVCSFAGALIAARIRNRSPGPWTVALVVCLLGWELMSPEMFSGLPLVARALVIGLLVLLPLVPSGILFGMLLDRSGSVPAALGANLSGAIVGGALESLALVTGFRALSIIAAVIYGCAWYWGWRSDLDTRPA